MKDDDESVVENHSVDSAFAQPSINIPIGKRDPGGSAASAVRKRGGEEVARRASRP